MYSLHRILTLVVSVAGKIEFFLTKSNFLLLRMLILLTGKLKLLIKETLWLLLPALKTFCSNPHHGQLVITG